MKGRPPHEPPAPGVIRIFLCGDVMPGRGLDQALPHPGDPALREDYAKTALAYVRLAEQANGPIARPMAFADIWGAALDVWRHLAPDVRLMNLETAVTASRDFEPKGINYRMSPENLPALLASGVDACALANNHVRDFGQAGLSDTLDALHAAGLATAGAGRNLREARAPAFLPAGGRRIAFYSVAAGDAGVPPDWAAGPASPGVARVALTVSGAEELAAHIATTRGPDDLAVLSIHWGSNWGYEVPEAHRRFARALIDSGEVAVVHGHSSHHPRPVEVCRGRLILYGCGDFLNDYEGIRGYEVFRSGLVAMYFADIEGATGALTRLQLVPLEIRRFRLQRPAPEDAAWMAERLTRESRDLGVRFVQTADGVLDADWRPAAPRDHSHAGLS